MSPAARFAAAVALALGVALACAGVASATEYGPIRLVSSGVAQQADEATATAISADGRFLAFAGKSGPEQGVFRENLESGAIEPVAVGETAREGPAASAVAPSISADGRYVSFTTRARLDPGDDLQPSSKDVYVADMSTVPPAYELASALDGCDPGDPAAHAACGLTYSGGDGSEASGRVALSVDGRRVAFVTSAETDLTSGPGGSTEGVPTPAGQVVLRDLASDETRLVSVERTAGGAFTDRPVPGGAEVASGGLARLRGAALSGDGSTVAWLGIHLPAQVGLTGAEAAAIAQFDNAIVPYDEPLWRRIADGPGAPTRRIVGGPGAPFPVLTNKNELVNGAQGWLGANVDGVPRLSADGRTVALIGNPTEATNLFLVDMSAGLARGQAIRQLTRETVVFPTEPYRELNAEAYVPLNGHIYDLALSPDGRRIAFASARQRYPLSPPNLVGSPLASLGLVELYVIELGSETLQRATHGLGGIGEPSLALDDVRRASSGDGAGSPSLGADGRLAFASNASNLVVGDGNRASDAFLVEAREAGAGAGAVELPGGSRPLRWKRPWRLTLTAFSLPSGDVRVIAVVPAAGRLRAGVGAELGGRKRGALRLASGRAWALERGPVPLVLQLPRRYRRLAQRPEGLFATAKVKFRRKGRRTLTGRLQVHFHVHRAKGGRR
ncbi:MAG: hypothetical protein ACOYD4_07305 [Solirubrobacterales bacterium]